MSNHNGKTWFPRGLDMQTATILFTDASDVALAGICMPSWTMVHFSGDNEWISYKSIAYRELLAVVVTIATFGNRLRRHQVVINIDNMGMCHAIQSGKSPNTDIMGLLRALYFYSEIYNIDYHSVFIDTKSNSGADAISRLDFVRLYQVMPCADRLMTEPRDVIYDF